MKKLFLFFVIFCSLAMFGCGFLGGPEGLPMRGALHTNIKAPYMLPSSYSGEEYSKVGTAKVSTIFGLIVVGDASIEAACKNGNITKIHHVDHRYSTGFLGLGRNYTIYVYGD